MTRPISHRRHPVPAPAPAPAIEATSIGAVGLFVPFVLVFVAAMTIGGRHPAQLALSGLLIVFPIAILLVRRRAKLQRT